MSWSRDRDGADVGLTVRVAHVGRGDAVGLTVGTVRVSLSPDTAREIAKAILAAAEMVETGTTPRFGSVDPDDAEAIARAAERYQRGDA